MIQVKAQNASGMPDDFVPEYLSMKIHVANETQQVLFRREGEANVQQEPLDRVRG